MVEAIHEVGDPGDIILRRHDLEAREALEHPADDQVSQGELDLLRQLHIAEQHPTPAKPHPASAGQDVKRKWHIQVLGCGPEGIIIRQTVGFIFRRCAPNQGATQPFLGDAREFLHCGWNILQSDYS